jgi:DNA-nicking Smr family endonuclease
MRKPVRDDDFRAAVADVAPISVRERHKLGKPPARPDPLQSRRDEREVLAESLRGPISVDDALDSGEELAYLRAGVSRQVLRRLRSGHWVVQASLDLHGMDRHAAAAALAEFMRSSVARGARCVRIVHGKGLGSRNREPVLKGKMKKWLPLRDEVLAFCQAPSAHGGAGALLVLLGARRRRAGRGESGRPGL